jgi:hypothetical protein
MIMRTFAERYDFSGKIVLPVTTYAVSGLGTAADEYADACGGATIGRALAVRGERVRDAEDDIDAWLRRTASGEPAEPLSRPTTPAAPRHRFVRGVDDQSTRLAEREPRSLVAKERAR